MRILLSLLLLSLIANAGVIHPQLAEILKTAKQTDNIEVIVHMKNRSSLDHFSKETPKEVKLLYLQEFAANDQREILDFLAVYGNQVTDLQTWWIFNGFMFTATKDIIQLVAARADVDYVIDNFNSYIDAETDDSRVPEWGIDTVKAPLCWNDGYDGSGIIVGNIDTGVEVTHPAFGGRWVPGGWFDGINGLPNPYDDHNHGTHTMGTICGGDGNGPFVDDIGVAPGAQFIAAKG